jgi:predicted component of type VI protein secretion system
MQDGSCREREVLLLQRGRQVQNLEDIQAEAVRAGWTNVRHSQRARHIGMNQSLLARAPHRGLA